MKRYPIREADVFAHRPKPFYFITTTDPEALSESAMHDALSALKEEGFGGIVGCDSGGVVMVRLHSDVQDKGFLSVLYVFPSVRSASFRLCFHMDGP